MDEEPPDIRFLVLALFLVVVVAGYLCFAKTPQEAYKPLNIAFLEPIVSPYIDYYQLNQEFIDCICMAESGGNVNAIGKAGEIGCMQFLPNTFQTYCVERYGYTNEINNCDVQKLCAAEMIAKGLLGHWTTANICLNTFVEYVAEEF